MLFRTIDLRMAVATIIAALALSLSLIGIQLAEARVNNSDPVTALSQQQDNVASRVIIANFGTSTQNRGTISTSTDLVDLSDTTSFKHFNSTGAIEVSQIRISNVSTDNSTTTLKFGLLASTTASGALGDIYWFDEVSFIAASNTPATSNTAMRQEKVLDYQPSVIKLGVTSGAPSGFLTNDSFLSNSGFATATAITSPKGTFSTFPGVGDLVMRIETQGFSTTSVTTLYRVK